MRVVGPILIGVLVAGCSGSIDSAATGEGESGTEETTPPPSDSTATTDVGGETGGDDSFTAPETSSTETETAPSPTPICLGKAAGAYCGSDEMKDADAATLYQCPGAGKAPTSSVKCDAGCQVEIAGTPDHCKSVVAPDGYRLPWPAGTTMKLTQDCNDSCCSDHVGVDQWAYDFANGTAFTIVAARAGTVSHLKINSTSGCGTSACVNDANLIVIDHGDGTQALYMHLQGLSLRPGVACGATVTRGQALATAGTTGWSTGVHLHFQVQKVHAGAATCECGGNGQGCSATTVPWAAMWPTATYPTVSIAFAEWPTASSCANRRMTMPPAS